jgi:hypothetical protein
MTKITSKNQSGGITAKKVSFDKGSSQLNYRDNSKVEKNKKRLILTISGIIAFIASIMTILAYFNIYPFTKN